MVDPKVSKGYRMYYTGELFTEYDLNELDEVWQCSCCEKNYEEEKEAEECCKDDCTV